MCLAAPCAPIVLRNAPERPLFLADPKPSGCTALTAGLVPVCQIEDTSRRVPPFMTTARIYNPAKTAMQSGTAKTKSWVLDFEQASPKAVEPLMGWTSSSDTRQQVRLRFDSKEEAIAYCER